MAEADEEEDVQRLKLLFFLHVIAFIHMYFIFSNWKTFSVYMEPHNTDIYHRKYLYFVESWQMKVTNNARISFQKKKKKKKTTHTIISFKIIPLEANNIAECNAFNNVRQQYLSEVEKLLALRNSLHCMFE